MSRYIGHWYNGLSVAATTSSKALKNKLNVIWLRLKSLGRKSKSLPQEVELCILICSMFPDDSRIPIDDLVMYLMGLKLFENVDDMSAARTRVNDLISIINDLKYPRNVIGDKTPISHKKDQCLKLLVGARNLAKMMPLSCPFVFGLETIQEKWPPELRIYKDFYGLSLVLKKIKDHPIYLECPKLAMLHLQHREDSKVIPAEFFQGMKGLLILSLDIPSLPQSLSVPLNLTTLILKVIKLEDMSWIGSLINLEFLSISTSSLVSIPREMGGLEKLRLLDLKKVKLAYIPPGVFSRMLRLEELYLPISFGKWGCKTKQLDDCDDAEFGDEDDVENMYNIDNEIDDAEKINASLAEIVSPSLNVLQISIPNASVLPKGSPVFKTIRRFKVYVPNYIKYPPIDTDSSNELHLTGDARDIKESGICDLMSISEKMSLVRVNNLKNICYFVENSTLPLLKKMIISECKELEYVVDATENCMPQEQNYLCCKLESLHLSMLCNLKGIYGESWQNFRCFSNLNQLSIRFCHKLKYVFSMPLLSTVIRLKDIQILDCNEMVGVFYEDEEGNAPLMIAGIENLDLHSLPKFIGFSLPKGNRIDGVRDDANQSLITTEIISSYNENLTKAVHGNLESFVVKENISSLNESRIGYEELTFQLSTNEENLHLGDTQQLFSPLQVPLIKEKSFSPMEKCCVFSSKLTGNSLRKLKRLKIAFCDSIAIIFLFDEKRATSKAFTSLKELELYGLRNLVHIWFQMPQKTSAFQNLQLLALSQCNNNYLFSPQVAKLMVQLQRVYISRCEKMEEIILNGDQRLAKNEILFLKLHHMELQQMPNLKIFSSGSFEVKFPLLDSLRLIQCNKMKSFSTGVCWTPKLERIEVNGSLYPLIEDLNATVKRCVGIRPDAHIFSFADLKKATENFRSANVEGGFRNVVYTGWLHERTYSPSESGVGKAVTIKKLTMEISQDFEEWLLKVNFLSRLSHPNLTKLVGYCAENKKLFLVYEFVERGSLANHLFRQINRKEPLSWEMRLKIAIGAARGLAFLHDIEKKDAYKSFSPSHILLDGNYNAKISYFGFEKWEPPNVDEDTYLASNRTMLSTSFSSITTPEYFAPKKGKLPAKSDAYGFGVVLLQLMTGLMSVTTLKPILWDPKKLINEMDASIVGQYSIEAMMQAAQLSWKCMNSDPQTRPSMKQVVEALEQIYAIKGTTDYDTWSRLQAANMSTDLSV